MSFLWPGMDFSTMVERDTSAGLGQLFSQEGAGQSNQGSLPFILPCFRFLPQLEGVLIHVLWAFGFRLLGSSMDAIGGEILGLHTR